MPPDTQERKKSLSLPIAIVVAGALIAGAIFFVNRPAMPGPTQDGSASREVNIPAVSTDDHILGNPAAKVVVVEYSDLECPFCKQFHATMHAIIDEFGTDGRVAWVYRHFPLPQLHSRAPKESEATECVAELGGNEKFWQYTDAIFKITPSNNQLDPALLTATAVELGINKQMFTDCLASGTQADKVERQYNEAIAAGAQGTPFSVIVVKNQKTPIEGAYPLATMRALVRTALEEGTVAVPTP